VIAGASHGWRTWIFGHVLAWLAGQKGEGALALDDSEGQGLVGARDEDNDRYVCGAGLKGARAPVPVFCISCYDWIMHAQDILTRLRDHEPALRAGGVSHAALFGSRARNDHRPDSDIDIMVEFDPAARVTVFNYAGLKTYIADLFDGPVDVVNRDALKPYVRPAATADALYAF
jgi:uncharacterized protein